MRTDYVNDILAAAMDGKRQYQMINNPNGTVSFVDVTQYDQNGDILSAGDINGIDTQINVNTANIATNAENITKNNNQINLISGFTPRDITSELTDLSTAIAEQNLEKYGYKIGDYFLGTSSTPYAYWLADMNTFYGGYNSGAVLSTPHIAVVVDTKTSSNWYSTVPAVGYKDSTLHAYLTGTVLTQIQTDITARLGAWSSHMLAHEKQYNKIGGWDAVSSQYISALTEVQIYGAPIMSYDKFQQGEGDKKLAIFDKYKYNQVFGQYISVLLRCLADQTNACQAVSVGNASLIYLTNSIRAVGLILIY